MNVIKQPSCRVTQLWFERASICKRMCYMAPCNSINILALTQKLLQALVGARRNGRAQKGTVVNKGIKFNLTSYYSFLYLQNLDLQRLFFFGHRTVLRVLTEVTVRNEF